MKNETSLCEHAPKDRAKTAASVLVACSLAVGLCPSPAFAEPQQGEVAIAEGFADGQESAVDLPSGTTGGIQEKDPSGEGREIDGLEQEDPAPPSNTTQANPETVAEAVAHETAGETEDSQNAAALSSVAPKQQTINGVTFSYYDNTPGGEGLPSGWRYAESGIYIVDATGSSTIVVPKQIDGKNVVSLRLPSTDERARNPVALDTSGANALVYLMANNCLSSLDVSQNPNLKHLECRDNGISSLDVTANPKLDFLDCSSNQLSSIDVSRNTQLSVLYLYHNRLTSIDVSKNTKLTGLAVSANRLSSLDVSNNPELVELGCADNDLTQLNLSRNTKISRLQCENNKISSLDVSPLPNLTRFFCQNNLLTELTIPSSTNLHAKDGYFQCFGNYIADTSALTARYGTADKVVLPQNKTEAKRLEGAIALDTMTSITKQGFADGSCDTVVVATLGGYWDALTASALAGIHGCPILMTDGQSLSSQTSDEIKRLGATKVYIAGGTAAVSADVEASIKKLAPTVERLQGPVAIDTALAIYNEGKGSWGTTAVVATSETFQDALSVSPYAFAKNAPIFLANARTHKLDDRVISAIKSGGFSRIVIVGGTAALSADIENSQLKGIPCKRLAGATAYETSSAIATWCLTEGMTAANVGVATGESYYDALAGAALCGKTNSALVLVSDSNRSAIDTFIKPNKNSVARANVFGGPAAVSNATLGSLSATLG